MAHFNWTTDAYNCNAVRNVQQFPMTNYSPYGYNGLTYVQTISPQPPQPAFFAMGYVGYSPAPQNQNAQTVRLPSGTIHVVGSNNYCNQPWR